MGGSKVRTSISLLTSKSTDTKSGIVTYNTTSMTTSTPKVKGATSTCPTVLSGPYEPPHLIIQIDKTNPNKTFGNSYFGHVSSNVSTLFNFDVPTSDAGKTCTIIFLLPVNQPPWSGSYVVNGIGGIDICQLTEPANDTSTHNNVSSGSMVGSIATLISGNCYVVAVGPCVAGKTVGYS